MTRRCWASSTCSSKTGWLKFGSLSIRNDLLAVHCDQGGVGRALHVQVKQDAKQTTVFSFILLTYLESCILVYVSPGGDRAQVQWKRPKLFLPTQEPPDGDDTYRK